MVWSLGLFSKQYLEAAILKSTAEFVLSDKGKNPIFLIDCQWLSITLPSYLAFHFSLKKKKIKYIFNQIESWQQ